MKSDRVVVGRFDAIDESVRRCAGTANLSLQQGIEGPLHIPRSERAAIVELHSTVKVKDVSQRIGNVPAFGERRLDVQVLVTIEQVVEQQGIDTLRLRVYPNSRIEIGRAALDDHDQGVAVGLPAAGAKLEQKSGKKQQDTFV